LLITHLHQALDGSLPVRVIIATAANPEAVEAAHDASRLPKTFHVREDFVGRVASFDGDKFEIVFEKREKKERK
jgi:hypothetical protein